ncbi:exported hypothetical protein [Magnetospirillum molischianum DSM 120]|uniref:Lipoprotein n=1 Tax=Magnetospirillum molischianum DSM 120 TaxID=1150626 RepID=H8FTN3_MAGML|nr:exported hypothetical protein [Magnetospirillum molischianum DSM 120]
MTRRRLLGFLTAGLGASVLSACGRRGKPETPEGATYPNVYPYTPYPGQKATTRTGAGEANRAPPPETDQSR